MKEFTVARSLAAGVTLSLLLFMTYPAVAADEPIEGSLTLQYRPRLYVDQGHDFVDGGGATFVRHRARFGGGATYDGKFGVYLEMQDVRTFGEEMKTGVLEGTLGDFSADSFDLHQGYASVMPVEGLELRVGRQEISIENHRLIGTVGFTEQARSFDGARLVYTQGQLRVDGFFARVADDYRSPLLADTDPSNPSDVDLGAVNVHYALSDWASLGGLAILDTDDASGRKRITAGLIATGGGSGISYSAEGYYQMGRADGDVSFAAYLAALHLRYSLGGRFAPFFELFGEVVSGDDDTSDGDKDVKTFDTLYATNHKFYGEMDFFLNLPVHTGGLGLMDIGAQVGISPLKKIAVKVTGHQFMGMEEDGAGNNVFGTEVDVRVDWIPYKKFKIDLVYAIFLPGEIFEATKGSAAEHFAYTTLDVSF
jgi:hypothetical protein